VRSELDGVSGASLAPQRALPSYGAMSPAARRCGVAVARTEKMLTVNVEMMPSQLKPANKRYGSRNAAVAPLVPVGADSMHACELQCESSQARVESCTSYDALFVRRGALTQPQQHGTDWREQY
jgi:hypothetical protein